MRSRVIQDEPDEPPGPDGSPAQQHPKENVMPATTAAAVIEPRSTEAESLPTYRLNLMRVGYLVLGVGLAIVKWPVLLQELHLLPVMDGVVAALLTAMSLLAFLGLRYPVRLLPILLFESAWKLIWIAAVAIPSLVAGDMDTATREVLYRNLWVVIILAVIPWGYVWKRYVRAPGDRWR
jgi:hypothetical protein